MAYFLSISSILLDNFKIVDLKTLFAQGLNLQIANHNLLNKFVLHRFNQYRALNAKD